ncbi:MAG TPA: PilZ domain-containing protein [Terriglobales bacterium]|jgi:hypothetical protein|nr:PilZ domain-containing protein [Terriglobales bacterium]
MTNPFRKLWPTASISSSRRAKDSLSSPAGKVLLLDERRRVRRHFQPLSAMLRYGIAATETPVRIHDVSDKGLCFRGEVSLPIGAAVEITTTLPQKEASTGRKVRYLAHVVRVSREPGKFVTAALIFRCETLAQEADGLQGGVEASAVANPEDRKEENGLSPTAPTPSRQQPPSESKPRECRRFSRYHCATQVQFRTRDAQQIASGELMNLSLSGCYVQTPSPCPLGAAVEIVVQAGRARIYSHGRVKAIRESKGMALEFEGNLAQRLQRLPRFVQMVAAGEQ